MDREAQLLSKLNTSVLNWHSATSFHLSNASTDCIEILLLPQRMHRSTMDLLFHENINPMSSRVFTRNPFWRFLQCVSLFIGEFNHAGILLPLFLIYHAKFFTAIRITHWRQ